MVDKGACTPEESLHGCPNCQGERKGDYYSQAGSMGLPSPIGSLLLDQIQINLCMPEEAIHNKRLLIMLLQAQQSMQ
jgi:hypothetical protein